MSLRWYGVRREYPSVPLMVLICLISRLVDRKLNSTLPPEMHKNVNFAGLYYITLYVEGWGLIR